MQMTVLGELYDTRPIRAIRTNWASRGHGTRAGEIRKRGLLGATTTVSD